MTLQDIFDKANKDYTDGVEAERKAIQAIFDANNGQSKICCICGEPLAGHLLGWTEQDVCSGRCWAELFGEP